MTAGVRHTPESFWALGIPDENGCLVPNLRRTRKGYTLVGYQGRTIVAHRLAWLLTYGELPSPPLVLDHLCRNRACINVAHLEPVTVRENVIRGRNAQREKTHCPHGHPLSDDNLRRYTLEKQGKRSCRACHTEQTHAHNERRPFNKKLADEIFARQQRED